MGGMGYRGSGKPSRDQGQIVIITTTCMTKDTYRIVVEVMDDDKDGGALKTVLDEKSIPRDQVVEVRNRLCDDYSGRVNVRRVKASAIPKWGKKNTGGKGGEEII